MRRLALFVLLTACGGDSSPTDPAPIDFTPLEGSWTLTPPGDSAKQLVISGVSQEGPAFATIGAAVLWGNWQYTGSAHLSADSLVLVVRRTGHLEGPTINVTYGYTVTAETLALATDTSSETYVRAP